MLNEKDSVLVEETGAGRFQVRVSTGDFSFVADEPIRFGGLNSGPNPFDFLCAALGACTVMTMRMYTERKDWHVPRFRVQVRHRKGSPNARDSFERTIAFAGGLEEEQRRRLLEIANRCPVHLLLERGADVTTSVTSEPGVLHPSSEGLHGRILEELCADAR